MSLTRAYGGFITSSTALSQYSINVPQTPPAIYYNGTNGVTNSSGTVAATSNVGILLDIFKLGDSITYDNHLNFRQLFSFDYTTTSLFCECWVNSTFSGGNLSAPVPLFSVQNSIEFGAVVTSDTPPASKIGFYINGTAYTTGPNIYTATPTWHHMAFSVIPGTGCYVYLDGTAYFLTGTIPNYSSSSDVYIGNSTAGTPRLRTFMTYTQDLRLIKGGAPPTTNFTPTVGPWPLGSVPSYVSGGTNVLGLAAQYFKKAQMYQ